MPASSSSISELKIVLLGDRATGKHCYLKRLTHNMFANDTRTNKECDIISTTIKIDEDTTVPIKFFNISGSQIGRTQIKKYFKNIDGFIIMFDVTRADTYDNVTIWKKNVDNENQPNKLPCLLLANKCDLPEDLGINTVIDTMDNYCEAMDFSSYFKISVRENIHIEQSIRTLIRKILERKNPSASTSNSLNRPTSMKNIRQEYTFKILVIGERGAGKTALIQRYVKNTFSGAYLTTIGADLAVKKLQYKNNVVNLHIWDIAGEERFGSMTHLFYKEAVGCLVVFDVTKPFTLTNGAVKWKSDFDKKVNFDDKNPVPCLLIGNKCDLRKEGMIANETEMKEFCIQQRFIRWFETSAKENINIEVSFVSLVEEIMKNVDGMRDIRIRSSIIKVEGVPHNNNGRNCCS